MNEWMNEIFILFSMNDYYIWEQVMSQMDETIEMVITTIYWWHKKNWFLYNVCTVERKIRKKAPNGANIKKKKKKLENCFACN